MLPSYRRARDDKRIGVVGAVRGYAFGLLLWTILGARGFVFSGLTNFPNELASGAGIP
jgi:hypothetical protein